ncbi:hypothetical protein D9M68_968040 [compost metagenome]
MCVRAHSLSSSARRVSRADGRNTTKAFTVSPRWASNAEITQASCTAGWPYRVFSISAGQTLRPAALIIRLRRSVM